MCLIYIEGTVSRVSNMRNQVFYKLQINFVLAAQKRALQETV